MLIPTLAWHGYYCVMLVPPLACSLLSHSNPTIGMVWLLLCHANPTIGMARLLLCHANPSNGMARSLLSHPNPISYLARLLFCHANPTIGMAWWLLCHANLTISMARLHWVIAILFKCQFKFCSVRVFLQIYNSFYLIHTFKRTVRHSRPWTCIEFHLGFGK